MRPHHSRSAPTSLILPVDSGDHTPADIPINNHVNDWAIHSNQIQAPPYTHPQNKHSRIPAF